MDPHDAENRELLIALLALRIGLVDRGTLAGAFDTRTRDLSRPITEILTEGRAIDADERGLLEGLADKHLQRHGGDAARTVAALNVDLSNRESLATIDYTDIGGYAQPVRPGNGGG